MAPPLWPRKLSELCFVRRLGRGFFGEVWECRRAGRGGSPQEGSQSFAVKKIPLAVIHEHHLMDQMEREIAILRSLRHPHIVQLYFDFRDDSHVYLGMEFAEGGGMFNQLTQSGKFTLELAAQYFYEVCDALEYLHTRPQKVIHRDIKPENILLDKEGHVKLADFGWSNVLESATFRATFCGTPDYLAPEMIRGEGHTESLDMWEMGVLLYEMTIGKSPFGSSSQEKTCRLILQVDLRFPQETDADAQDLITKLCKLRPEERLTAAQAKQHAFVQRHHGRPTVAVGEATCRPSVEARWLRRDKEILEGELAQILQAKSALEQNLLKMTEELEDVGRELRSEQLLGESAEERLKQLKECEARQQREAEELRNGCGC